MCDCSDHPCKVCGKALPLHLGDFDTAQDEVECFCGKHIPKDRTDVRVWRLLNEDKRDYKTGKMAIKALTDNARFCWDGNAPNADCEELPNPDEVGRVEEQYPTMGIPNMRIRRVWAMPCADTFDCPPIGDFVKGYHKHSVVSVDPFARNKQWTTFTNDIDPETRAEYHMDAIEFICHLRTTGVRVDLALFDPPYSVEQCLRRYTPIQGGTAGRAEYWAKCRDAINDIVQPGGVVLSFGWDSMGMGKTRGYEIEEVLLVCHGACHNDTICVADRKMQGRLDG